MRSNGLWMGVGVLTIGMIAITIGIAIYTIGMHALAGLFTTNNICCCTSILFFFGVLFILWIIRGSFFKPEY